MPSRIKLAAMVVVAPVLASVVLVVSAAAPGGGEAAAATAEHGRLPRLDTGSRRTVKPPTMAGWTFDGSQVFGGPSDRLPHGYEPGGSLGRIDWVSWTHRQAVGEGVVWTDDCEPSCAEGTWHGYPTRVVAFRVRRGFFQRMHFVCICDEPRGTHAALRYRSHFPPEWRITREW